VETEDDMLLKSYEMTYPELTEKLEDADEIVFSIEDTKGGKVM
jgi:hypothetical protein